MSLRGKAWPGPWALQACPVPRNSVKLPSSSPDWGRLFFLNSGVLDRVWARLGEHEVVQAWPRPAKSEATRLAPSQYLVCQHVSGNVLSGLLSWTIQSILWAGVLVSWAREHQDTPEGAAPLSQDWKRWQGHFQVLLFSSGISVLSARTQWDYVPSSDIKSLWRRWRQLLTSERRGRTQGDLFCVASVTSCNTVMSCKFRFCLVESGKKEETLKAMPWGNR